MRVKIALRSLAVFIGDSMWFKFKYYQFKYFITETLPWFIAWNIPRKVALFCFVRVYSAIGDLGEDYETAYKNWESGIGK